MKNFSFKTIGNITLIAIVLIAAQTANAADSLFDKLFGSNEIVNSFLAEARIGGSLIIAQPDDLAPLAVETWSGGDSNDNLWTSNDNWAGIGGAGAGDDLVSAKQFVE